MEGDANSFNNGSTDQENIDLETSFRKNLFKITQEVIEKTLDDLKIEDIEYEISFFTNSIPLEPVVNPFDPKGMRHLPTIDPARNPIVGFLGDLDFNISDENISTETFFKFINAVYENIQKRFSTMQIDQPRLYMYDQFLNFMKFKISPANYSRVRKDSPSTIQGRLSFEIDFRLIPEFMLN